MNPEQTVFDSELSPWLLRKDSIGPPSPLPRNSVDSSPETTFAVVTTPQRQTLPVVDFAAFQKGTAGEREQFVRQVGEALQQIGFFALVNHGLSPELIREAYEAAEAVFLLPEPTKRAYEDPALLGQRGYTPFGKEHAKDHPYPDMKEFWHIGREGDPHLPANIWPREVPQFRRVMVELFAQLETCAQGLLQAVSLYLGEPAEYLPKAVGRRSQSLAGDSLSAPSR
jgi:isopenicillin N synthase-like dioxygenase